MSSGCAHGCEGARLLKRDSFSSAFAHGLHSLRRGHLHGKRGGPGGRRAKGCQGHRADLPRHTFVEW